jgi:TRAP-type mannitol/chloroaromatic compound transport system substrate-binding protein
LTSSFPKNFEALYGGAEVLAKIVAELTQGKFQIQCFGPGELVGAFQALDATSGGTVEMAHTAPYYYVGKDPTFTFGTALPWGLNARQTNAWLYQGGGLSLLNEFYSKYDLFGLPGGNTGAQMGGFFRKELKSVQDLSGLKMRVGGIAGQILQKLGVVPQQIPGGETYAALERGTIDGAELVAPYDDEKLGIHKVAPYYYYPGFWEGGPSLQFLINKRNWEELPDHFRLVLARAADVANADMLVKYDARNPAALRRLVASGTQLRPFPQEILEATYRAASDLYDEISAKNENFRKIYDSYRAFRGEEYLWWQVAEYSFDNFMIRARTR